MVKPAAAQETIPVAPTPVLPVAPEGVLGAGPCFIGVSSCTAASCHGNGHKGFKGSEYNAFVECDPHARAYRVLFDERSARIAHALNDPGGLPAEKNPLCLACHATTAEAIRCGPQVRVADGVGCESCHGPARNWVTTHYLPEWQHLSAAEKAATGFRPLKDLAVRARVCTGCHVGNGDADMNHDLIAAGHPRLNFEFASYQAIYPKHWNILEDKARYPDFEARSWSMGQLATAQAALELLAHRASVPGKPWPEFAEYDCFACHQNLPGSNFTPRPPRAGRLGGIPWGTWYYSQLADALREHKAPGEQTVLQGLADLRAEMNKRNPDRAATAVKARRLAAELSGPLQHMDHAAPAHPSALQDLFGHIFKDDQKLSAANWDNAMQRYLALAALYHGMGDLAPNYCNPQMRGYLETLARQLAYPPGQESPGNKE
jgi:hypothetical protein